jgi:MEMO1 family protein
MSNIRVPAVAGQFYADDPSVLESDVRRYVDTAAAPATATAPKILIVPHAGYVYSGAVAGAAYAAVKQNAATIKKVILFGPSHRVAFHGLAAPLAEFFETPLGAIPIDQDALSVLKDLPQLSQRDDAHAEEHSLEVQLPFLQALLGPFDLTPIVVGDATGPDVAAVIERLWGGAETLIVISTDLSHYLNDQDARKLDDATASAIESIQPDLIGRDQACGRIPVTGALLCARARNMRVERYSLCNSGDTAGGKDRVVGYGAWGLFEPTEARNDDRDLLRQHGEQLLNAAGASIKRGLVKGAPPEVDLPSFPAPLQDQRATFITLKKDGALRGCIGSITARRPLISDVVENAYAAAFKDHRFPPLQEDELRSLTLSISLLGKPQAMSFENEADFVTQIRPGTDGLIIEDQGLRAVFLPQVWEDLPTTPQFLAHLKQKAGLPPTHWSPSFKAWRFTATSLYPSQG